MKRNQSNPDAFAKGLKNIAKASLESDEELIIQWWSNKYKLPHNHPLLMQYCMEELLIEYYQDQIQNKNSDSELPQEIIEEDEKWNGETSEEHEKKVKKMLSKEPQVNLDKYRSKEPEEIDEVF